jgi:hypothetical protein
MPGTVQIDLTERIAARPAVLELGEDIGAAVIYTKGVHDGAELEIKPHGSDWNGHHTAIRRRPSGRPGRDDVYAALFYGLRAGRYDLRLRTRA